MKPNESEPPLAEAIATVVAAARPGAKVVDLCDLGDKFITE